MNVASIIFLLYKYMVGSILMLPKTAGALGRATLIAKTVFSFIYLKTEKQSYL